MSNIHFTLLQKLLLSDFKASGLKSSKSSVNGPLFSFCRFWLLSWPPKQSKRLYIKYIEISKGMCRLMCQLLPSWLICLKGICFLSFFAVLYQTQFSAMIRKNITSSYRCAKWHGQIPTFWQTLRQYYLSALIPS